MRVRRLLVVAALTAGLVVAGAAFVAAAVRLTTAPAGRLPGDPFGARMPSGARAVFDEPQSAGDRAAARPFGFPTRSIESATVRLLARPDGLLVLGWRSSVGEICEGVYRPGPTFEPVSGCSTPGDFTQGGVTVRWPDSPDLGPIDILWQPDGGITLLSARPPGGIRVTPRPSPTATIEGG
ncbi:hypothetical protein [Pseudolysinimonas sp.]|uniref:hypothetical protein n=1 Tax=Pseudolysinimonas sp. TaxID=2680009 RepID=UPI003F81A854